MHDQDRVLERNEDRHEQFLWEVVNGLREAVDGKLGDVVVVVVVVIECRDGFEGVVCFAILPLRPLSESAGFCFFPPENQCNISMRARDGFSCVARGVEKRERERE